MFGICPFTEIFIHSLMKHERKKKINREKKIMTMMLMKKKSEKENQIVNKPFRIIFIFQF